MAAFGWKLVYGGKTPPAGAVVRPDERLGWAQMTGLGAQHVVAMFGATFVFPVIMGLNPNLAVLMSGVATIMFLLIVNNKVPSYLGTSASFVGAVFAIRAQGGDSADVTGSILVAGVILALVGVLVHFGGAHLVRAVLPPAVTGAVVMLIGFNLASVATSIYFPDDQWVALLTTIFVVVVAVGARGFIGRIAIFLGLIFGYLLSWLFDQMNISKCSTDATDALKCVKVDRINFGAIRSADWLGVPKDIITKGADGKEQILTGPHLPSFSMTFILLVIPAVIALLAENAGHVKAVSEMTGDNLDPYLGRAFIGDGVGTAVASFVGGSPTTTYAENIGVMAATRVYSTLAYYIAALVAILFGFCPKFGALVASTPNAVLGGITLVLYGMIGLLGAKIWIENRVNFANPINLVPLAAGIIAGIGPLHFAITHKFSISGIAAGTILAVAGWHAVKTIAPAHLRDSLYTGPGGTHEGQDSAGGSVISVGPATGNLSAAPGPDDGPADGDPEPGQPPRRRS
ncbi:MAG: nitrate reductase [Pseudonocardiales bacterium]|nr:MAG: nitrate reductase [Pseudonocardiales bacterium]